MAAKDDALSRRGFMGDVGRAALLVPLSVPLVAAAPDVLARGYREPAQGEWDLSWVKRLEAATDRAIFDWPGMGSTADPIILEIAARYLDNCAAAYGGNGFRPGVVLNIRTTATAAGLSDDLWERFSLGTETSAVDPDTNEPARRNPFWRRAKDTPAGIPDLAELMQRGCIVLICDFALGHLSERVGKRIGRDPKEVHQELRAGRIPGAFIVPSGIFGLVRSQNAGCGLVRL